MEFDTQKQVPETSNPERGTLFQNHSSSPIFKSQEPLENEYLPSIENFKARNQEIQSIVNRLSRMIEGQSGSNFIVTGNTGYGKTACVKLVLKDLEDEMSKRDLDLKTTYIDDSENEHQILRKVSKDLALNDNGRYNQFYNGTDLSKYYNLLTEHLTETGEKYILVLDEIDQLFSESKDKDHGNSILKKLYETRAKVMNESDGGLVVIGVTNNIDIRSKFNSKNASRYADDTIQFSAYNSRELKRILEARAEKAFKDDALEEGVLSKISAKVAQEDGDARRAIRILRKTGRLAEDREMMKATKELVDEAEKKIRKNEVLQAVRTLPKQQKILLYSLIDCRRKKPTTGDLHEHYEKVCSRNDIKSVSQRRVRDFIKDLDMMGLAKATSHTISGTGGKTRKIEHEYGPKIQEEILNYVESEVLR
jgi:cell division control protein 6